MGMIHIHRMDSDPVGYIDIVGNTRSPDKADESAGENNKTKIELEFKKSLDN